MAADRNGTLFARSIVLANIVIQACWAEKNLLRDTGLELKFKVRVRI
jgi:hypothetical protein